MASIHKVTTMLRVRDVRTAVAWYTSIGGAVVRQHEEDGVLDWVLLTLGRTELMLSNGGGGDAHDDVSFWYATDRLDDLHRAFGVSRRRALRDPPATP